jgi:hypothetical protein
VDHRDCPRQALSARSHLRFLDLPLSWELLGDAKAHCEVPVVGGNIHHPRNILSLGKWPELSAFLKTDKDFLTWIHSLPDLDAGKKKAVERERTEAIASLKQRGFAELSIRRLRRTASGLNFAVYGLGLISFLIRDPHHVLTWSMVALPWVAILLVANFAPFYRFGGPRNSPLPDLSLVLIIPGLFLMLHALQWIAPIGWDGPLLLTVCGSAILVGLGFWCDPWLRKYRGLTLLLLILCCGYGYGAGLQVNALLDRSTPKTYRVIVTGKYVSHGRSTSYNLKLAPWGPNPRGQNLMVFRSQYEEVKAGCGMHVVAVGGTAR